MRKEKEEQARREAAKDDLVYDGPPSPPMTVLYHDGKLVTDAEAIKLAYDPPVDPYLIQFPPSPQAAGSEVPPIVGANLETPVNSSHLTSISTKKNKAKTAAKKRRKFKKKSKKYLNLIDQAIKS